MEIRSGCVKSINLISVLLLTIASFSYASEKSLHLVTYEEAPYVFAPNGEHKGLVVEVVSELMNRTGIKFDLTFLPPKRALLHAIQTSNTCVFPIERSQEREVKLRWVSPVLISRNGFYARSGRTFPSIRVLNDAKNYRIGSVFGSAIGEYLESLGFNVDLASDNQANLVKLAHDRIDLWAVDTLVAQYISKQNSIDLGGAELVFFTTLRALGCNLDVSNETIMALNETLAKMYQEGFITQLKNGF